LAVRQATETVQVNLRIKEALRRRLEREAEKHQISLNKEMQLRLEDSLRQEAVRGLDDIRADMEAVWLRYSERHLLLSLEDSLAEALSKTKDREVATLAAAWLHTRAAHRRGESL
jgi:hypothetical protein